MTKKCCNKCGEADDFAHIADAFWATCELDGDCLQWMGTEDSKGYGVIGVNGRQWKAHRVAKALSGTLVPHDLVIDHLWLLPTAVGARYLVATCCMRESARCVENQ